VQHRIWKLRRSPGYSDVMAEASDAHALAAAQRSEAWGVDVMTAGTRLPDTLGALLNPRLGALVEAAARSYDYVIIDGAPMFVGDAPVLARLADLVLLVVRPGLVERRRLSESVLDLNRMPASKGVVFNGVSRSTSDDYYYYGSDYRYAEADQAATSKARAAAG
jgi:Mrp family chromosome partitioning ATPase